MKKPELKDIYQMAWFVIIAWFDNDNSTIERSALHKEPDYHTIVGIPQAPDWEKDMENQLVEAFLLEIGYVPPQEVVSERLYYYQCQDEQEVDRLNAALNAMCDSPVISEAFFRDNQHQYIKDLAEFHQTLAKFQKYQFRPTDYPQSLLDDVKLY